MAEVLDLSQSHTAQGTEIQAALPSLQRSPETAAPSKALNNWLGPCNIVHRVNTGSISAKLSADAAADAIRGSLHSMVVVGSSRCNIVRRLSAGYDPAGIAGTQPHSIVIKGC